MSGSQADAIYGANADGRKGHLPNWISLGLQRGDGRFFLILVQGGERDVAGHHHGAQQKEQPHESI